MSVAYASVERDVARLQNVFNKLAYQNHPLRSEALKLRDEISANWLSLFEKNEWFAWPSTSVRLGPSSTKLDALEWRPQGMLSFLGYHVGETSGRPSVREAILEYAFDHHLPPVGEATYFEEWGEPRSARRLRKLANTIAALTRNAKKRDLVALSRAVDEWEQDLGFLYERYYLDLLFRWPSTDPSET